MINLIYTILRTKVSEVLQSNKYYFKQNLDFHARFSDNQVSWKLTESAYCLLLRIYFHRTHSILVDISC